MRKPAFQFYPADWRNNAKLRRCSWEARGAWVEIMCLLHDSEEYGLLRWSLKELAQAIGAPLKLLKELVDKDVLKGGDKGFPSLIYRPRTGRVDGEPVVLIKAGDGSCWYSSRMVIDEHKRQKRGEDTRFTTTDNPSPKGGFGEGFDAPPKSTPSHRKGDGSTSSSSSTTTLNTKDITHTLSMSQGCVSDFSESPAGEVCKVLHQAGFPSVSETHPELLVLIDKGVKPEQFAEAAKIAKAAGKSFAYMLGIVRTQIRDANAVAGGPCMPETSWEENGITIRAKAKEVGFEAWAGDGQIGATVPELFTEYTKRLAAFIAAQKSPHGGLAK